MTYQPPAAGNISYWQLTANSLTRTCSWPWPRLRSLLGEAMPMTAWYIDARTLLSQTEKTQKNHVSSRDPFRVRWGFSYSYTENQLLPLFNPPLFTFSLRVPPPPTPPHPIAHQLCFKESKTVVIRNGLRKQTLTLNSVAGWFTAIPWAMSTPSLMVNGEWRALGMLWWYNY